MWRASVFLKNGRIELETRLLIVHTEQSTNSFELSSLEHAYYPITALQMNGLRLSLKGKVCPKVWIQWHRFPRNATNFKLVAAKHHALRSLASGLDSDRETGKGWTPGHLYYVLGPWKKLKAQTYIYRALNPEHLLPRSARISPKNSSGFESVIIIPAETPDSKAKTSRENTSCLMQHGLGSRVSCFFSARRSVQNVHKES